MWNCNTQVHVHRCWVVCVEVMLSPPYRLLNHAHLANLQLAGLDKLLEEELEWQLTARVCIYYMHVKRELYALYLNVVTCCRCYMHRNKII